MGTHHHLGLANAGLYEKTSAAVCVKTELKRLNLTSQRLSQSSNGETSMSHFDVQDTSSSQGLSAKRVREGQRG